jgi:hypothetical protein
VKLVAEAQGKFGNLQDGRGSPLKAVTRQQLVRTQQTEKT